MHEPVSRPSAFGRPTADDRDDGDGQLVPGAVGKVAIYEFLVSSAHYKAMTGKSPSAS